MKRQKQEARNKKIEVGAITEKAERELKCKLPSFFVFFFFSMVFFFFVFFFFSFA
jgi:hypothetical protein